jgi:hypothetical protein
MNRNPGQSSMLLAAIAFVVGIVWFVVTGALSLRAIWCWWRH